MLRPMATLATHMAEATGTPSPSPADQIPKGDTGLGRLSSLLAHEINNPLGGLLNATDTIRSYADRPEVVKQSAELLDRGPHHLRDVARAMLGQYWLDRRGMPLSAEDFADLRLLV